jgi:hypothetical protein
MRAHFSLVWRLFGAAAAALGLFSTTGICHAASQVVGWGNNDFGQRTIPTWLSNVVAIAAGSYHSLALTGEGRVFGWGWNGNDQTNIPSGLSNVVAIAAGENHSLALTAEGRVVGWGSNGDGQTTIPSGLSNVVAIAAGGSHSLALTAEGWVVAWGANDYGETNVPIGLSNVVAVAAGAYHSLALTAEGRVVGWGNNGFGQTIIPSGLSNVVAIATGDYHSLALTAERRVAGWGSNSYGQRNIPSGLSNAAAIAAGGFHCLALTADSRAFGWGDNGDGQATIPSGLSNLVAVAGGGFHSLALTGDDSPAITLQPASQSVLAGATVTFQTRAVWAAGTPPPRYQWRKEGTELPGQTNAVLRLAGVTASHAGNYTVVVSNFAARSATSSVAALTVNCLLDVTSTSGGSVTRNPDLPLYAGNSFVTLTAIPAAGYGFIRWSGDATGSTNPLIVTLDTNKSITAVFASVALTMSSQGAGTVTKAPDQALYSVGDQVTLTATPARWLVFSGWTDGVTNNPRLVTIGESNVYTAVFTPITPLETVTIGNVSRLAPVGMPAVLVDGTFILAESISVRDSARVTVSTTFSNGTLRYTLDGSNPATAATLYIGPFSVGKTSRLRAIAYNADLTQSVAGDALDIVILPTLTGLTEGGGSVGIEPVAGAYFSNDLALVTATVNPGWTFLQWLGDATGTNLTVSVAMTRNKSMRAVFGTPLNTTVVGAGSIVMSPVSPLHPYGSTVRLTAVPTTGSYLAFWANAASGQTNNPLLFTVTNASPTVTAVFSSLGGTQTNALTVIWDGQGQVTLTPPGNRFRANTNVVLLAVPEPGQEFLGWSGPASGTNNPLVVAMNSNKVITASFTKRSRLQMEGGLEVLRQDGFRLTLTGEFGARYQILGSSDLSVWTPLATLTNDWGTVQFTDGEGTNLPRRLYQALSVE